MRKPGITVAIILLAVVGLACVLWLMHQAVRPTESEIATSVAQEIVRENLEGTTTGYKSLDGTVIAEVSSLDAGPELEPYEWFDASARSIWKYEGGALKRATTNDMEEVKLERSAFLYIVVVRRIENATALVDIAVQYPASSTAGFTDGGYASHWQLKFLDEKWELVDKDDYLFWD